MRKAIGLFCMMLMMVSFAFSQSKEEVVLKNYIEKYKDAAICQMEFYGVPASIVLAQGILESHCGTSKLAREANNHFGIKHSSDWAGGYIRGNNNKYRKYCCDMDSYTDHSSLLRSLKRYSFLFEYSCLDYKSWARGLRKAGYATDPRYPKLLITIIEKYELFKYDMQFINKEGIAKKD